MPLTPQTSHIGTVRAGSTISQVVHPMDGIIDGFSILPFGTSTNTLNIFSLLLTLTHFSYPAFPSSDSVQSALGTVLHAHKHGIRRP